MQKIHRHGTDGNRYFWTVTVKGEGTGEYRSRHSTPHGVKEEFAKNGKIITKISPVMVA